MDFLTFALPDIGEEEIEENIDTLKSGWRTTGPKGKVFEKTFSDYLGDEIHSVAVNSATAGLHRAFEAIGIKPGDEGITTPYTFTATAEILRYLGAHPVFVDIDATTMNIDVRKIESAIPGDLHAWHLYGIRLNNESRINRDIFIEEMAKRWIACSVHLITLHKPNWRDQNNFSPEDFQVVMQTYEQAISLPIYKKMTEAAQTRVIKAVREILA